MSNIIWKGINSNTIPGLLICNLPPITKPKIRTEVITIDGVDGDIINNLGYEAYDKSLQIALTRDYDINQIINYFNGEGNLILSNENDKYYKAKIINRIDYEKLLRFKTATVTFHCQPFKYSVNEEVIEETITSQQEIVVTNNGNEKSKPVITIQGTGTIGINLNGILMFVYEFDSDEEVTINSEQQDAYYGNTLKNRYMAGEFPILESGENIISWDNYTGGLTKIKIKPNSRWL